MSVKSNGTFKFWRELKRRKVIPFLIAYLAACFAIIEFLDITSSRFTLPEGTFDLLYVLGVIGLPVVIILPWLINKKVVAVDAESKVINETPKKKEKKVMHNLPAQLTAFIGRNKETRAISEFIGKHRIITITGAGGCGKTRLTCEVAKGLIQDFKDGVWFVDLAPIIMEDLVANEIAEVLNIPEEPGRSVLDTLIHKLEVKNLLIILDNCEHLINACSEVAGKLTQSVPGLQILATSREPLKISGEKIWRIPSLSLVDPKSLVNVEIAMNSEAVSLFTNRARLNNPDFELAAENVEEVVTICNKLDGIPLALELVASRTRHINPSLMLERLSDKFELLSSSDILTSERQKTLHATIDWGYNLLSDNEKLLFTRLPVFMGGFELSAVEKVCADEHLPSEIILDLLSSLVDKSIIFIANNSDQSMSYNFYDTLRQFALQKLQSQKMEDYMRERHLQYYLELARVAFKDRILSESKWLKTLELDNDNFIAALHWSESHAVDDFIDLAGYLAWYWSWHNHFSIGGNYLDKAQRKGKNQTEAYARVIAGLGLILFFTGVTERGFALLKESRDIYHHVKNYGEQALQLSLLSLGYQTTGDYDTGLKYAEEGLKLAREVDNPGIINVCLSSVCQGLITIKKVDETRTLSQQLLNSSNALNQPSMIRLGYHFTADCDLMEGKFNEAEKGYASSLEVAHKTNNMFFVCIEMLGVAFSVAGQSRFAKAIRSSTASREYASQNGFMIPEELKLAFWMEFVDTYIVETRKNLGEELNRKYEEEGKLMGFNEAIDYAQDFNKD